MITRTMKILSKIMAERTNNENNEVYTDQVKEKKVN